MNYYRIVNINMEETLIPIPENEHIPVKLPAGSYLISIIRRCPHCGMEEKL